MPVAVIVYQADFTPQPTDRWETKHPYATVSVVGGLGLMFWPSLLITGPWLAFRRSSKAPAQELTFEINGDQWLVKWTEQIPPSLRLTQINSLCLDCGPHIKDHTVLSVEDLWHLRVELQDHSEPLQILFPNINDRPPYERALAAILPHCQT